MPLNSPKSLQLPSGSEQHLPIWKHLLEEAYAWLRNDIALNSIKSVRVAADYTAGRFNRYIGVTDTAAKRTITMPTAKDMGKDTVIIVMDESGGANDVDVARGGADTINGANTYTLNAGLYESAWLISDGVSKLFAI